MAMGVIEKLSLKTSHPSKQRIIAELYSSTRPLRVYEIAERIKKDKSTVEYHLNQLRKMELVEQRNIERIKAYDLSKLGRNVAQGIKFGYLSEEEEINMRIRELATILGIDTNSDKFEKLEKTISSWYSEKKETTRKELLQPRNMPSQVV